MNSMGNSIGIPEFIRGLEWAYLLLWGALLLLALWLPKSGKAKLAATLLVLALGIVLPAYLILGSKKRQEERQPIVEKEQAQFKAAMARFEERCKTAGEKIYRTVENVEGVFLLNVRSERKLGDRSDPNWPDAGLPHEPPGEEYLWTFLFWEQHEDKRNMRGYLNNSPSPLPGYRFVDIKTDIGFQRVRLEKPDSTKLVFFQLNTKPSRYAVGFENFLDPEDRKLWVAGTKVTITDTATKEILAEKIWYSVEPGQGSTEGFRSPWGFAKTCPFHLGWSGGSTRFFVDQVLKPKKGE
jgi:hypothetical protein